jgi:hypothetical protein
MFWGGALLGWLVSEEAWMEPMLQPMLSSTFISSKQTISIAWVVDLSSCLPPLSSDLSLSGQKMNSIAY